MDSEIAKSKQSKDVELDDHIRNLDNFGLKSSGWMVEPLKNVENDYVSDLCNSYLQDLERRKMT